MAVCESFDANSRVEGHIHDAHAGARLLASSMLEVEGTPPAETVLERASFYVALHELCQGSVNSGHRHLEFAFVGPDICQKNHIIRKCIRIHIQTADGRDDGNGLLQ